MTESSFSNILSQSAIGAVRKKSETQPSPWNRFLTTLDSKPNMPASEAMSLFAQTLAGARSDWKDSNDNTLLMHMASRGQTAIVKRLIHELYADVRAVNKDGLTALHMGAREGHMAVCQELNCSGANPAAKDKNGMTPADMATNRGHTDVADFLKQEETSKKIWILCGGMSR